MTIDPDKILFTIPTPPRYRSKVLIVRDGKPEDLTHLTQTYMVLCEMCGACIFEPYWEQHLKFHKYLFSLGGPYAIQG